MNDGLDWNLVRSFPAALVWLVVHREIRSNRRIRAVYDCLAQAVPQVL